MEIDQIDNLHDADHALADSNFLVVPRMRRDSYPAFFGEGKLWGSTKRARTNCTASVRTTWSKLIYRARTSYNKIVFV